MRFVDFHVHTSASDGSFSPGEVVAKAAKAKLTAIGITDHDTMDGIYAAGIAGKKFNMEIIPGIEFSTHLKYEEIHILGYYCRADDTPLIKAISRLKSDRYERMEKMVYKINNLGLRVTFDEVLAEVKGKAIGRPHLARVLCKKGYCKDLGEAFARYIGFNAPAYVKRKEFTPVEAIEIIRGAGGVPVLAHPGSYGKVDFLPSLIEAGLMGIEVFHPRNSIQVSRRFLRHALRCGLLITGGSDYHGEKNGQGTRLGDVKMDLSFLKKLKQRSKALKRHGGRF